MLLLVLTEPRRMIRIYRFTFAAVEPACWLDFFSVLSVALHVFFQLVLPKILRLALISFLSVWEFWRLYALGSSNFITYLKNKTNNVLFSEDPPTDPLKEKAMKTCITSTKKSNSFVHGRLQETITSSFVSLVENFLPVSCALPADTECSWRRTNCCLRTCTELLSPRGCSGRLLLSCRYAVHHSHNMCLSWSKQCRYF